MDLVEEDILMHYGVKRRSGRYPWGSGDNPYQHGGDFLARVEELQRLGKTEKQIADELHLSTTDLRMQVRVAKHERRALQADRARSLREDGKTLDEIASILGYANDSSVRALLNENTAANKNKAQATAEILKKELAEKGAIDVGTGVERQLGVSTGVLQEALFILETEGYNRYGVGVPQVNDPKKRTITPVISVPEIDQREVYQNLDLVKSVGDYHSTDGGESWDKREYPASIDSSRVKILYGDEGGTLKDGVIEIRRGVADLDLGDSHYAQVRILVDGTHYLKGMAMYSDDMPDGADIVFNTNKHTGTPKMDVLKKIQDDPDNPFGALIKVTLSAGSTINWASVTNQNLTSNPAYSLASTANANAATAKSAADDAYDEASAAWSRANKAYQDRCTDQNVFDVLTSGGTKFGIFSDSYSGRLYINADYIRSGTINADYIDLSCDYGGFCKGHGSDGQHTTYGAMMYGSNGPGWEPYIIVTNAGARISGTGADLVVSGGITMSEEPSYGSDLRIKNSIDYDLASYEAFFLALKPSTFKYNKGTSGRKHFGFIAQDVEQAMLDTGLTSDQLAALVKDPVKEILSDGITDYRYSIRYGELIALNTHMIQKLYQMVEELLQQKEG